MVKAGDEGEKDKASGTGEHGTSLVEFAMILPALMLVLLGFLQLALWAFQIGVVQYASNQACRAGAAVYQPLGAEPGEFNVVAYGLSVVAVRAKMNDILTPMGLRDRVWYEPYVYESGLAKGQEGEREYVVEVQLRLTRVVFWDPPFIWRTARCRLERFYSY